jgi:spermidine synthase
MSEFPEMVRIVPEKTVGVASVQHFEITETESRFSSLRPGEYVPPGKYAKLLVNGRLWMSDTRMERTTNWEIVYKAHGNVLIAGLGLGMILHPLLKKKDVTHITVVEKHADVIALIQPTLKSKKITIVHGDIFTWRPEKGTKFDAIYFDIWADHTLNSFEEMRTLHKAFRAYRAPDAWVESWRRRELRSEHLREQRQEAVRKFRRGRMLI